MRAAVRVTIHHPDAQHIQVFLNGEAVECVDADTVGGYVVLAGSRRSHWVIGRMAPIVECDDQKTVWGRVSLVDRRTGRPYDELYQEAERAALAQGGSGGP